MTDLSVADLLLLSVVNTTNVLTFFIFVSRVKWPNAVSKLAIATILMAIPAIVIASLNNTAGREWLYWVAPLVLIAWAVLGYAHGPLKGGYDCLVSVYKNPRHQFVVVAEYGDGSPQSVVIPSLRASVPCPTAYTSHRRQGCH